MAHHCHPHSSSVKSGFLFLRRLEFNRHVGARPEHVTRTNKVKKYLRWKCLDKYRALSSLYAMFTVPFDSFYAHVYLQT